MIGSTLASSTHATYSTVLLYLRALLALFWEKIMPLDIKEAEHKKTRSFSWNNDYDYSRASLFLKSSAT